MDGDSIGNLDIFTWSLVDIPRISSTIAQHCLDVLPGAKPMKQKKKGKRNLRP